mmetsp:Transcript_22809/g.31886  ORF Transcript_22809/g.31886 Transcript_22809/m.31886 type:complete len:295 (+) Transcript_22809:88-972(+)
MTKMFNTNKFVDKNHSDGVAETLGKPSKPLSAYSIFFEERRCEILSEAVKDGTLTQHDVTNILESSVRDYGKKRGKLGRQKINRIIRSEWKQLSEKEKRNYEVASKKDMERCRNELQVWRKTSHDNEISTKEPAEDKDLKQKHQQQKKCNKRHRSMETEIVQSSAEIGQPLMHNNWNNPGSVMTSPISSSSDVGSSMIVSTNGAQESIASESKSSMILCSQSLLELTRQAQKSVCISTSNLQQYLRNRTNADSGSKKARKNIQRGLPITFVDDLASQLDVEAIDFLCSLKRSLD